MTNWLSLAKSNNDNLFDLIEKLVSIETPTRDKAANDQISSFTANLMRSIGGEVTVHSETEFGDHIAINWPASDGNNGKQHALVVGHLDTVWPRGTLEQMGYSEKEGRLYGPGVLDMKAGIATTIVGLQTLKHNNLWPDRPLTVLFNTDEEVGSPSSRPLVEHLSLIHI